MDAALSWLSSLFGDQPVSQDQPHSTFDATNPKTTLGGYYQPNSGSCIDPEGSPRCNL
jgi:hypothetical protein